MKKYYSTLAIVAMAITSVFGFTSCQDDSDDVMQSGRMAEQNDMKFSVNDMDCGGRLTTRAAFSSNPSVNLINCVTSCMASVGNEESAGMRLMATSSDVMDELKDMCEQQQEVIGMMDMLQKNCSNEDMVRTYNDYLRKFHCMKSFNMATFGTYCSALALNKQGLPEHVLEGWASHVVNGGSAPSAVYEYLREIINPMNNHHAMDVYDYWMSESCAWEHQGYEKREQMRLNDVCSGVAGYLLARDYFIMKNQSIDRLNDAFSEFVNYYMNNSDVVRHNDVLVCQIKGAHIVFNKNLTIRDMKNHSWMPDGKRFTCDGFMYGEENMKDVDVKQNMLSESEAKAIYNYYNADRAEGEKLTFEEIMKQAGFECSILTDGMRHVMPLNNGCRNTKTSYLGVKYNMIYNRAVVTNEAQAFHDNYNMGVLKVIRDGSYIQWELVERWDDYKDGCQYFRTNIVRRY